MPRREPPCLAQHLLTLWSRTQTPRDHWAEQLHPLVLVVIFLAGPRSSAGGRGASLTTARTPEISVTAADTFRPDTNRDSRSSGILERPGSGTADANPRRSAEIIGTASRSYASPSQPVQMHPPGGRLCFFLPAWQKVTSDPWVLSAIEGVCLPWICQPYQPRWPSVRKFPADQEAVLQEEVAALLEKQAIIWRSLFRNCQTVF